MTRRSELALLGRQLLAHDAWALRRAAAEAGARALSRLAPAWALAGHIALRLHPRSGRAHRALAESARRRGRPDLADRHLAAALEVERNGLEISVLAALAGALGHRRARPGPSQRSLEAEAGADFGVESAAAGERVDGILRRAAVHSRRGEAQLARERLEEAVRLDGGRADAWRQLARARAATSAPDEALLALESAADLDPQHAETWCALARARRDREAALDAAARALELDPGREGAIRAIESITGTERADGTAPDLACEPQRLDLEVGDTARVRVSVSLDARGALYVCEPTAAGIACRPRGRVALEPGRHEVEIEISARRPHDVGGGRAWRLELAAVASGPVSRASCEVAVPDRTEGRIYYLVTEDHELYDERESTEAGAALTTLVEKSRAAEAIANRAGVRWTHVVDVGSLALVDWAAGCDPDGEWPAVARRCASHLVDAVEAGNDLALHCHAFHDPETDVFCHGFDADSGCVTTDPGFLDRPGRERGYWSRAFPILGGVDDRGSRAWATWRGIGRLESLGRLADPRFRVALFRAGSFDFGDAPEERARSLELVQRLFLLADSDVPKPRLYVRPVAPATYPVEDDPARPAGDAARLRALEMRAEYNVESDFLSDRAVLDRYLDRRVAACRGTDGRVRPGTHVICAMTHDKFINFRMGRRWDSLDPDYGDWRTIREHLARAVASHPELRFARARDAVLDWYEHHGPRLLAWRDEEIVRLAEPGAEWEEFVYGIRLLGRGIEVSAERPRCVRVALPAWPHGAIGETWIERDAVRWPSRRPHGVPGLEFEVDSREARFELCVRVRAGAGITADVVRGSTLYVSSPLAYRRATVEVPQRWSGGHGERRIRDVRLARDGERWRGRIELAARGRGSPGLEDSES